MPSSIESYLKRLLLAGIALSATLGAMAADDFSAQLARGVAYRQQGHTTLALDALNQARAKALTPVERAMALGELGVALQQAHRLDEAEAPLRAAHAHFRGVERARYAIDLGNLALSRRQPDTALRYFREAMALGERDPQIAITAALNAARLQAPAERAQLLAGLASRIAQLPENAASARMSLNLGNQARSLGPTSARVAYEQLERARRLALAAKETRLSVEAYDALAQLYEDQKRDADALRLTRQGIAVAAEGRAAVGDLLIQLHWRQGRFARRLGDQALALAGYRAAVEQVESIRQDIPIEYEGNRSSFRETLEPIYLGLADLLLADAAKVSGAERDRALRQVRAVVELIKQSEMQDYLGERCSVLTPEATAGGRTPEGVAVLYPIIFPDRLELLLETPQGLTRHTTQVTAEVLRKTASEFSSLLRSEPKAKLPQAARLYDWLLRPLEGSMASVRTLVVVPDGVIRTLPMGALHDGKRYVIENMAVATAPGLSMTRVAGQSTRTQTALVAGLAEPGPVVDKLSSTSLSSILQPGSRGARGLNGKADSDVPLTTRQVREARDALSLPGVKLEVEALSQQLNSKPMLNGEFTLKSFSHSVGSGEYDIVHIASHGVFGGSGAESFILAHDDLLTMDKLQGLLRSDGLRKRPIRLLTLSACETAEGNERAPLGIAGAALKANAETALGTLWPVEDNAATLIMQRFYLGLGQSLGKAEALRRAQLAAMADARFTHPFYWAPFIIVGNWD